MRVHTIECSPLPTGGRQGESMEAGAAAPVPSAHTQPTNSLCGAAVRHAAHRTQGIGACFMEIMLLACLLVASGNALGPGLRKVLWQTETFELTCEHVTHCMPALARWVTLYFCTLCLCGTRLYHQQPDASVHRCNLSAHPTHTTTSSYQLSHFSTSCVMCLHALQYGMPTLLNAINEQLAEQLDDEFDLERSSPFCVLAGDCGQPATGWADEALHGRSAHLLVE